ncbi:MAG TPA: phosphatidate cytidylyltransferase [Vicinamibacteria bacterium]|nr:phosphatidate cytidylyltransferase [Vicinamibacteria bacterium]
MGTTFRANLVRRVATAALVLPLLLAGLLLGPPFLGAGLILAALLLGLWEFFGLIEARGLAPYRVTGVVVMLAIFVEVVTRLDWVGPPLWPMVALVTFTALLLRVGDFAATVPAAALTLLGATYLGALGGTVAGLRLLEPQVLAPWRIVLLLAIVMSSDTVAFFLGSALGRRKLAPGLSPGKTVEGAAGGLAGGVLGALAVWAAGLPGVPAWHAALLGFAVAVLGMLGDLLESLLKRWAGVKDSGRLFPGHGGMLDRLDSLLFGAPVLYYYFSSVR